MNKNADIICGIVRHLMDNNKDAAAEQIRNEYPFWPITTQTRSYTVSQKMDRFVRDGFIDRYSGERLLNPGILKVLSAYFPEEFPYQPHWKMSDTHLAYWQLSPTIDHLNPIARGGEDIPDNWVTTSMMNNMVKSNWTLEELRWSLYPAGDYAKWEGLTNAFVSLVERDETLLKDSYIEKWYRVSRKYADSDCL